MTFHRWKGRIYFFLNIFFELSAGYLTRDWPDRWKRWARATPARRKGTVPSPRMAITSSRHPMEFTTTRVTRRASRALCPPATICLSGPSNCRSTPSTGRHSPSCMRNNTSEPLTWTPPAWPTLPAAGTAPSLRPGTVLRSRLCSTPDPLNVFPVYVLNINTVFQNVFLSEVLILVLEMRVRRQSQSHIGRWLLCLWKIYPV